MKSWKMYENMIAYKEILMFYGRRADVAEKQA